MSNYRNEYNQIINTVEKLAYIENYKGIQGIYNKLLDDNMFDIVENDKDLAAEIYYDFAIINFNMGNYEDFLDLLLQSQQCGYNLEIIKEEILEAFYVPNVAEFEGNYIANIKMLQPLIKSGNPIDFEKLFYRLLPFEQGRFYVFDTEKSKLVCKIDLNDSSVYNQMSTNKYNSFFDFTLFTQGYVSDILSFSKYCATSEKQGYIVIEDWLLFLACLQGEMDYKFDKALLIFDSIDAYQLYVSKNSIYLPNNVINLNTNYNYPKVYLKEIQEQRKQNKELNIKPLLSICIPSYNRGNRAYETVAEILSFEYGREVEIVLSNNGTKNETMYYYNKLEMIDDSRFKYFAFNENEGFATNMCKVAELATADLVMYLSDEDTINELILGEILNFLKTNNSISLIKTSVQNNGDFSDLYCEKPSDALLNNMLSSNYISGIIMNKVLLEKKGGFRKVLNNQDDIIYYAYPHMYWELLLCDVGAVYSSSLELTVQGKPEKLDGNGTSDFTIFNNISFPHYAKIESRLEQHKSFFEIFKQLNTVKKNRVLFRNMYLKLVGKTLFLCNLNLDFNYQKITSKEFCKRKFIEAYHYCINDEFFTGTIDENQEDLMIINNYILKNYGHWMSEKDLQLNFKHKNVHLS